MMEDFSQQLGDLDPVSHQIGEAPMQSEDSQKQPRQQGSSTMTTAQRSVSFGKVEACEEIAARPPEGHAEEAAVTPRVELTALPRARGSAREDLDPGGCRVVLTALPRAGGSSATEEMRRHFEGRDEAEGSAGSVPPLAQRSSTYCGGEGNGSDSDPTLQLIRTMGPLRPASSFQLNAGSAGEAMGDDGRLGGKGRPT